MAIARNGNSSEDPGKRLAILDQAIRTFAECGFRGTDVQVIADGAGVGKGTVYRYFRSKEDLFWSATSEVLLRLEQQLFREMKGVQGAIAKIRTSSITHAKFFESNPQYLEMFVQDRAEFHGSGPDSHHEYYQKLIRQFEDILQQGIDAGEIRPIDTEQTMHTLASLLYGIAVLGCHLNPHSAVQMTEHALDIFLHGIGANLPHKTDSSPS